ncbi:MAG: class I SAM-dependent methyltransferase [Chloroflexi bacterium]|nr:MAG: class I SAM-dependent methyltransferase [Chloroflexota bacterium]
MIPKSPSAMTAARYSEKSTMMRSSASPKPNTKARSSPLPRSLGRIVSTGASELASTSGTAEQNAGSVKLLDRLLQRWRIAKAAPYVARGARVLDVGCADGALFRVLRGRLGGGVGIDPDLPEVRTDLGVRLIRGRFPEDLATDERFDVITMLAVFEHLDDAAQRRAVRACARLLRPGGRVVVTVPEPAVDRIVHALARVGLVAGMALHEHHGYAPRETPGRFADAGFSLERHERFQLGLNNLYVFRASG